MKRLIAILFSVFALGAISYAQELEVAVPVSDTTATADSLVQEVQREHVLSILKDNISSSDSLQKAMDIYIQKNASRNVTVYRLRIFFDNSQKARVDSEQVVTEFAELFPGVPVYRGYANPYFKVTVGDFHSKSEAMKFLNQIKEHYPSVFLVRETFSTI